MGCDIHPYVEQYREGVWVSVYPDMYFDTSNYSDHEDDRKYLKELLTKFPGAVFTAKSKFRPKGTNWETRSASPFYIGRNYALFAKLADVRNNGDIQPISGERGIPNDLSPLVAYEYACGESDWHSASYYTVDELLAYDWNTKENRRDLLSLNAYVDYLNHGVVYYAGEKAGKNTVILTEEEAKSKFIVAGGTEKFSLKDQQEPGFYFASRTEHPYLVDVGYVHQERAFFEKFVSVTIPALAALGPPEHTRLVFWFDN